MDPSPAPTRILPEKQTGNQNRMLRMLISMVKAFCWWRQPPPVTVTEPVFRHGKSTKLVVVLHAYTYERADMEGICQIVIKGDRDADLLVPEMPFDFFSMAKPEAVCNSVVDQIDKEWAKGHYEDLIICGHSLGALLARKICLLGWNEGNSKPWMAALKRVVLFAPFNRGWKATNHTAKSTLVGFWLGGVTAWMIQQVRGRRPLIYDAAEGAVFLNNLRLEWHEMRPPEKPEEKEFEVCGTCGIERRNVPKKPEEKKEVRWPVIQLMVTRDDLVAPSDTVDPAAADGSYVVLEVPNTGHGEIVRVDVHEPGISADECAIRQRRAEVIEEAFSQDITELQNSMGQLGEEFQPWKHDIERVKVTDVVYVIHGIRDEGWWTARIAGKIKQLGDGMPMNEQEKPEGEEKKLHYYATETSSYGYFPMLPFALPGTRLAKMSWLVDQYVENLARYPNAERFHFVGHSNGTYMLAAALKHHPKMKFDHVVFAGSVVNNDYPWAERITQGEQVKKVLNYVATNDWVVALFPNGLGRVSGVGEGLGGAGHDGFHGPESAEVLQQVRYAEGGHSAALKEQHWQGICDFIVRGVYPPTQLCSRDVTWAVRLGRYPRFMLLVIITVLLALGMFVWQVPTMIARVPFPVMEGKAAQVLTNLGCTALLLLPLSVMILGIACVWPSRRVSRVRLSVVGLIVGLALAVWLIWLGFQKECPASWARTHPAPLEWLRIIGVLSYVWLLKIVVTKV